MFRGACGIFISTVGLLPTTAAAILFSDQAQSAGVADDGQANGAAFGDFDGDGWQDLAVFRFSPRTNALLYRNRGDGRFVLAQDVWQPPQRSLGGIFVDYDSDGDLDLYSVHLQEANILLRNDGGRFVRVARPDSVGEGQAALGASFGDFDGDGALDLFSVHRLTQGNRLYSRFFQPGFIDVSDAFSLVRSGQDPFSALPLDFDGDGDTDLYVLNRGFANLLHRNDGGGLFSPVGEALGVDHAGDSQAAFAADYDCDGDLDLYVISGGGQPNLLLRNDGAAGFVNVAAVAGVAGQHSSAAAAWGDFDGDGYEDLVVSNGNDGMKLYRNRRDGTFEDLSATGLPTSWQTAPPRLTGLALADYDNDGDIDIFAGGNGVEDVLLRNDTATAAAWLRVELPGALPGTRVEVGGQVREYGRSLALGSAYGDLLFFGLGQGDDPVDVTVRWAGGQRQVRRGVTPSQVLRLRPPVGEIDARIRQVIAPAPAQRWGAFAPEAEIENIGTQPLDGAILEVQVWRGTERVHRSERAVPALAAGQTARVRFAAWGPERSGEHRVFFDLRTGVAPGAGDTWERTYPFHAFAEVGARAGVADAGASWAAAWSDIDNDGDLDLYVSNGGAAGSDDNALYRNDGGTFADITQESGTGDGGNGTGVVFADFDRDGDQDLLIAKGGFLPEGEANRFFRNIGGGRFEDASVGSGLDEVRSSYATAVGDYDGDGLLDLYVTQFRSQFNRLFRNTGGSVFVDVTGEKEIRSSRGFSGAGGVFSDFDNDGTVELYASFYGGQNIRYQGLVDGSNLFEFLGDEGDNVGLALGDYDNDGLFDLYAVNESGRSVLYRNSGAGQFVDVAAQSGTENIAPGTGVAWGDYDGDGWQDLFVVNGAGPNRVYRNRGLGGFVDAAAVVGLDDRSLARAVVLGDYDGDGDLDAYVANEDAANRLYENGGHGQAWLKVELRGVQSNLDAIGARVRVHAGGQVRHAEVNGTAGLSQSSRVLYLGLGAAERVDSLVVRWPSGHAETYRGLDVRQALRLVEGGAATAVDQGAAPAAVALGQNVPNPFNSTTRIAFGIRRAGPVQLVIYDVLGQRLRTLVDGPLVEGQHDVGWDGRDGAGRRVGSGVYFYRLVAGDRALARSMVLVR